MLRRGMIVKLTDDFAIVATDESSFLKVVVKDGMRIGQKIYIHEEDLIVRKTKNQSSTVVPIGRSKVIRKISGLAAMIAVSILIFNPFMKSSESPYAVVSLDVNPSFEMEIDSTYRVISVDAINEDGLEILEDDIVGLPLRKAVSELIEDIDAAGYIQNQDNAILVSTVDFENDDDEKINKEIAVGISEAVKDNTDVMSSKVVFINANETDLKAADELELSIGKYKLYEYSEQKNFKRCCREDQSV